MKRLQAEPRGRRRGLRLWVAAAVVVTGLTVAFLLARDQDASSPSAPSAESAGQAPTDRVAEDPAGEEHGAVFRRRSGPGVERGAPRAAATAVTGSAAELKVARGDWAADMNRVPRGDGTAVAAPEAEQHQVSSSD